MQSTFAATVATLTDNIHDELEAEKAQRVAIEKRYIAKIENLSHLFIDLDSATGSKSLTASSSPPPPPSP